MSHLAHRVAQRRRVGVVEHPGDIVPGEAGAVGECVFDGDARRGPVVVVVEDEVVRDEGVDGRVPLDVRVVDVVVDEEGDGRGEEGLGRAAGEEVGVLGDGG